MGAPSGCGALAWALMALLFQKAGAQGDAEQSWVDIDAAVDNRWVDTAQHLTFIPPITVFPTMSTLNPAHNGRVCSTWGDFHYKTFDGDIFRFPGRCNYVFSAHCGAAYEDFNVQVRRGLAGSRPTITHVILKTQGLVLEISNSSVLVNGRREELPYSQAGLLVEQSSDYVKVSVGLVLTFTWNGEDSALLELDPKYANQTCGLCGDFNGLPAVNEFYSHNARLTPLQFGNLQKLDGPTEQCQDPPPTPADNCTDREGICHRTLLGPAFTQCNRLVDASMYVAACAQDLCRCPTCPCATFAEYSRQCAHAGGQPQNWRGPDLCPRTCPLNMQHQECGSPCANTCSNPERAQLCEDHCVDGCFCPPGTVLDDVLNTGCLPLEQCPCTHSGRTYAPGASFTTSCSSCTCSGGLWQCQDLPCPGTCSIQGGSHISTYDEKLYDMHGDCSYVLSKRCADSSFTVLAELRKCGLTDNENCLKTVTLSTTGDMTIRIQANGAVFMNSIYTQLPMSAANVTMFRPSTFFILVQTGQGLQLEVQLVPTMQVFLRLDPAHRGQMCGLCGNFNQNQADDFQTLSGVVEGTAAAFANTWKTQATCPNVRNSFEDPCTLSVENENYAQHWCSLLINPAGAFSPCHSVINPAPFHSNCLFDTCNCEKSEDCLCAALSSYVRACAAKGVLLSGWRDGVCTKYTSSCPKSQEYAYVVDGCQPTCRALSQADVTCGVTFVPVDGCICPHGTFLDDAGACVSAEACPCYFRDSMLAPGEVVHDNGVVCSCASGKLSCLGAAKQKRTGCVAPMVYLDCGNAPAGTPGAECLRSCHTLDVDCFSTHCVSGCVCPPGLVSDGSGGCVAEEDCPCLHNEATYRPGDTIRVDCNTCTCRNRRWECSHQPCLGTCVAYGDGHFITFDGGRYSFDGSCQYTLAQDHCGANSTNNGTFRIVTENVPCGTTGVTCSKAIKLFLENYELILHDGTYKVVQRGPGGDLPYRIRYMGIHLAVETRSGLVVSWDRKTSVFIRLHQDYKGRVCGLCGNFDDNAINDFTTRSQSVVGDVLEFGNSWKFSPSCPDAPAPRDPCTANPYRKSWAQKQCSIINSATFAACRSQVDSTKYYEACVSDACACDSGGDCECFCTAVAAYAQACRDVGVCVSWRSPDVCPLFCDYYNPHGECEWHYQPCGAPCLRTCRNPSGRCLMDLPGLEGCYPKCPPSKPFFNEDQMKCVAQCGCYDQDGNYYDVGTRVPTAENCHSCDCTPRGLQCTYSLSACKCTYEGRTYSYEDVIYNTTDGLGACLTAICGNNGTIIRMATECPGTLTTTEPSTTGPVPTLSSVCVHQFCRWSAWYDSDRPEPSMSSGDFETFVNLRQRGHQVCPAPAGVECRAQQLPDTPLEQLGQKVECNPVWGLTCLNSEQSPPLCHNYELRVLCCDLVPCSTPAGPGTSEEPLPGTLPTPTLQTTAAVISQTEPSTPTTTETRRASSSVAPGTTCQPLCQWTEWFDEDYPKSEEAGGDIESYDRIRNAGGAMCQQPRDIQCRAENFPDRTPEELGQRVHCDPSFGLVCRNDEQVGLFKMCLNYRIRVLCCSHGHCGEHAATTATAAATTATTTKPPATKTGPWPGSSPGVSQAPPGSTTAVTFFPTGPMFPVTSPNPSHTDMLLTSTTRSPTSPTGSTKPTTQGRVTSVPTHTTLQGTTGGTPQGPTPRLETMRTSTARPAPSAPLGSVGTVSTSPPPPSHTGTSTLRVETSRGIPELVATTEATTHQGTTGCQPKCEWTEWFDMDFPTSGITGGDMETYDNIRAAGGQMCREPQKIECRAESYPEVSIDQIGQVLTCSLRAGLVCRNRDQKGPFNMCFNYNIRVLCCDNVRHCPTATTLLPTRKPATPSASRTTPLGTSSINTTQGSLPTGTSTSQWSSGVTELRTTAITKTYFSSPRTTKRVPLPTTERSLSTPGTTERVTSPTTETGPSFPGTTQRVTSPTTEAGPSSPSTTQRVTSPTTEIGPSSPRITVRVTSPTSETGPSFPRTTKRVTIPTTETSPSTPGITKTVPIPTTQTTLTSLRTTERLSVSSPSASPGTSPTTARPSTPRKAPLVTSPIQTTSGSQPTSPTFGTTLPSSTLRPGPFSTSPTTTSSGACTPQCAWTDWFDEDYPTPGTNGGDFETYINIRAAGRPICERPLALECRAETLPDVPLQQLGQVVLCRLEEGLVCRNRDQSGRFKMCLNYHIRVLCCDYRHCPTTETGTTVTSPGTSLGPTSPEAPSTATLSTASTAETSRCRPTCRWTDWLDSDRPRPGRYGGDIETYYHIESEGGQLCAEPDAIECEAVLFPGVPLEQLGQVVQCDIDYGLICRNSRQWGGQSCLNYHIRVRCCDDLRHCAGTATAGTPPISTSASTSTSERSSRTTGLWTTVTTQPLPSSPGTPQRVTSPTTETGASSPRTTQTVTSPTSEPGVSSPRTTQRVTSPTTETGPSSPRTTHRVTSPTTETGPSSPRTTQRVTSPTTETGPSSPRITERVTSPTSETGPSSPRTTERVTIPTSETSPSTPGITKTVPIPTTQTTLTSLRTTERLSVSSPSASPGTSPSATRPSTPRKPPLVTSPIQTTSGSPPTSPTFGTTLPSSTLRPGPFSTSPTTTSSGACTPQCAWTDWFDEDYPTPGTNGGDFETYINIRAAGRPICERPLALECRAETLPDVPLQQLGQVVLCRLEEGLVCRNRDQSGRFKMCLNYHIRVLCCDYRHCPTTETGTTVTSLGTSLGPTSPTTPSTATLSTASTAETSRCRPTCRWTDWLDSDRPRPGRYGGDIETYYHIESEGGQLCAEPDAIECEAVLFPGVPLEQLGQVVQCDIDYGLICRNSRQWGGQSCLNYHIRVRCCDDLRHCAGTATAGTPPISTSASTSTSERSSRTTGLWTTVTTQPLPSSPGTPQRVTSPTTEPGVSSPRTTERVTSPTSETSPTSPGTTQTVTSPTTEPGPSSPRTTQRVTSPTSETGPSSPRTTQRVTSPTSETGPSSLRTTERVTSPTKTVLSSPGTTQRVTSSTSETGPSSLRTTERVTSPTKTVLSSPGTTQWVTSPTSETGPSSLETTQRVTSPTTEIGPSSLGTTQRVTSPTTETGPSSPGITERVTSPTTQTPLTSLRTTERLSVSSPSASPGTSLTTTWPSTPHKAPLVTSAIQTTSGSPPTSPTFGTTLPSSTLRPGPFSTTPATTTSGPCTPQCAWTDWFDEDYPTPGTNGGDFETFEVFRLAGHVFCEKPHDIECRSEKAPGMSLEDVGQVVQCNVSFGLVCRNRDQMGPAPYCHNFHVRLLCCDRHCTSPPGTTAGPSLSPETPSRTTLRPTTSPSPPTPTTPCLCRVFGQLFSPGDIVYNRTDRAGCHFYAICSPHCELDRFQGACPTSSPPESSASMPPTSPAPGCDLAVPPRQVNESWTLEDCSVARCEGDNHIVLLELEPVAKVTCVNGHLPIKVQNQQEPCQYHYECECSCSSWGGSNYVTFDGTPYSFRDNCTHVIMREIRPRYGNLTILLDNYYCGATVAPASCPRALRVHYESMEIVLTTTTNANGQEESLVLFDHTRVSHGFSKNGVSVSVMANASMHIDIPVIGASITVHGQVFQVRLSYSHFSHNTEGQCGTCTNSKLDDCRRPDGTMAPTCQDMADTWLVPESSKEGCWASTGQPSTTSSPAPVPSTPSSTPCPPVPLCELMLSQVFTECHGLIPPGPFFSTCISDSCQAGRPNVPCQSLEAYAALCRARGVCSDWRNATNGLCDLTCPPEKVYKPCGPMQPMSCDSRTQSPESKGLAEGCFCPDGHTLFNSHTDVCVPECPCVGPDGFPKFPGERWVSNCQACVCDEGSVSVRCVPVQCEARDLPLECSRSGFMTVTRPLADNPCCPETLCVCNMTTCPQSPPECGPGEEPTRTQEEGSCCPTFGCQPKLCTYNGTVYGVGATFPAVIPCHTCTCLSMDTQDPTVHCEEEACDTTCPQGSEYSRVAGQCCGECVQIACLTPHGGLVQPNETWVNSLVDNCTEYHCQAENGVPVLTPRPAPCPDMSSCRGILRKTGCCYSCEEVDSCEVRVNRTVLRHRDCEALVNVTFCEGSCPGVSKFSMEAQVMQRRCTCCQETRAHEQVVTMRCPDGTAVQYTYTHVDECSCTPACVPSPAAPEDSTSIFLS